MKKQHLKIIIGLILLLGVNNAIYKPFALNNESKKIISEIKEQKLMTNIYSKDNIRYNSLSSIEKEKIQRQKMKEIQEKIRIEKEKQAEIEKKQKEEQKIKEDKEKRNTYLKSINPYFNKNIRIETTFYSENEPTNTPGDETKTCIGTNLFEGVISVPNEIPLYSIFLFNNRLYICLDRGNPKCIKMLNGVRNNEMRIDVYKKGLSQKELSDLGVQVVNCKIIRWGGNKQRLNIDIERINKINKILKENSDIDIESLLGM